MSYNFDLIVERRGTDSLKWNVKENELPMWVADMDFPAAPEIRRTIEERAAQGVFGYSDVTEQWYKAVIGWWKRNHGFEIKKEWLMFCTGVVPAISSAVRKFTSPAENILVLTPVYNIFFNSIWNNGRNVLESKLRYDGKTYEIDFEDLEEKLRQPQTTMMILCNPHNPIGKIWTGLELKKIGELCSRYHVLVISDEIHCDLTAPNREYVPYASVSDTCRDNSIICVSPTKTFNLAGIQTAAIFVPNEAIRSRMIRAINTDEVAEPNSFAIEAAVAAFNRGEEWLEELKAYIWANRKYVEEFLKQEIKDISLVSSDATYLLWLDCRKLPGNSTMLCKFIRDTSGLYLSDGAIFHGDGFLRMNIACPRKILEDGLIRLKKSMEYFEVWIREQC